MVEIVGHRGAAGRAPENTLLSFQKAVDFGCQRAELDVRLTKDDIAVVIHDESIDRITNGHGKVHDFTKEEIQAFDAGQGEKIPTLEEVLNAFEKHITFQIELKEAADPPIVHKILEKHNLLKDTIISSFEPEYLKAIKALEPTYRTLLLFSTYNELLWDLCTELDVEYIGPKSTIATKELIDKAHKKGLKVYTYHTDDKKLGMKLISWGVDAIGTNFPKRYT